MKKALFDYNDFLFVVTKVQTLIVVPDFLQINMLLWIFFLVHLDDAVPGFNELSPLVVQHLQTQKQIIRLI